ncbi:tail fiber protein [Xenorhabdus nematophila]|uniref:tail fiber protein n=1 Tax=Xenorhabdus nematophila TaxID=628 RepID=UPI0032B7DE92
MQELMPPVSTPDNVFHDGDPTTGAFGTIVPSLWLNNIQFAVRDLQQECKNILTSAGFAPDPRKQNQLADAISQLIKISVPAATVGRSGIVSLSNATNSNSETDAATSRAVKAAYDNANTRLEKSKNGADIQNKAEFVKNLGLAETVNQAKNAYPKTGGVVNGDVHAEKLFSQSIVGIAGDNYGMQLTGFDTASFEGNNLEILSWYGVGFKSTASGKTNVYVNVRNGDIVTRGSVHAGGAVLNPWGDISGSTWGGFLSHWIERHYAKKNSAQFNDGNGWFRDTSTGFTLQWGVLSGSNGTFNFPVAFNNECFAVFVTNNTRQGSGIDNAFGYPINRFQFFAATKSEGGNVGSFPVTWWAIGR